MDETQDYMCKYTRNGFNYPAHPLVMSTLYSLTALVTTVLNFLILISIWKTPSLHKPSYILIGSLALSDLLVGAIGEPLVAISLIAVARGWSLKIFCLVFKCALGVVYALGAISLLTLTLISLDRLLAVKLRNRYQSVVTQKRVLHVLLACWILTCGISGTLFGYLNLNSSNVTALLLSAGILVFILVFIITTCYSMAFYSLRKIASSSSISPSVPNAETDARPSSNIDVTKYRKSLITMFVVFICTILFYVPFICTYLALAMTSYHSQVSKKSLDMKLVVDVAELIVLLNSAVNPLLYLWRIRDIREAVKTTVKTTLKIF